MIKPGLYQRIWDFGFLYLKFLYRLTHSCFVIRVFRFWWQQFSTKLLQEVMKDPRIAADGYTYEAEAIQEWLNFGHDTSPMTNLKLEHCDLIPNYALHQAIQEWQQHW